MAEDDDNEDPDGRDGAMRPLQQFLNMITKKISVTQDDDYLAPFPYTAPSLWWRKSETEVAGIQWVDGIGVAGRDAPMVPSHCQIQQFLISKKVPATQDDNFLALILYTAPPHGGGSQKRRWWGFNGWMGGVGGYGLEVVGVSRGWGC